MKNTKSRLQDESNRRETLRLMGAAGVSALVGCAGDGSPGESAMSGDGAAGGPDDARPSAPGACEARPLSVIPLPEQAPATTGMLDVSGVKLWYWDTGGSGKPVVFLHAASGSGQSWSYQQPVFARAQYRAVGYSRRGAPNSDPGTPTNNGTASGDLHALVEHLRIDKFHAVAIAAGGAVAFDYALSHPERLLSLTIACSLGGVTDPQYGALIGGLRPMGFSAMPAEFRELGPCYRASNAEGVKKWAEHATAVEAGTRHPQPNANQLNWANLERITVPTMLMTGDADLWMPPAVLRTVAGHVRGSEIAVIPECGHAPHWERPDVFNAIVLAFVQKHSR
jgi:pimeloyl-ACP methyl ester carboxylesterase